MGVYVSLRGWIEYGGEMSVLVKVATSGTPYAHFWHFEVGGYSEFAFFGGTIREAAVLDLQKVLRRIAAISVVDGEFTDYPEGVFHLAHEFESIERAEWAFRDGVFVTSGGSWAE